MKTRTTRRQIKFRKMMRKRPVVIVESSPECDVSHPFRPDTVENLIDADTGADYGGFASGGLPETNRRKF